MYLNWRNIGTWLNLNKRKEDKRNDYILVIKSKNNYSLLEWQSNEY